MRRRTAISIGLSFAILFWTSHPLLAQKDPGNREKGLTQGWEQANAHFLKGKDYLAKKELDKAEAELNTCLEIQPEHADALFFLAQVDYMRGDFDRASADIQKAEAGHAAKAAAYCALDLERRKALLEERRRKEEEVSFREEGLNNDLCKTDHQKLMLAETIDALRGEISVINAKLNEPLRTEPPPLPADYSYIHGNILFKRNKFQEAESQYLRAIETEAGHPGAYNNLINLYYMGRNYQQSLKFIEQAERNGVTVNPKLKEAVLQIAKK